MSGRRVRALRKKFIQDYVVKFRKQPEKGDFRKVKKNFLRTKEYSFSF